MDSKLFKIILLFTEKIFREVKLVIEIKKKKYVLKSKITF